MNDVKWVTVANGLPPWEELVFIVIDVGVRRVVDLGYWDGTWCDRADDPIERPRYGMRVTHWAEIVWPEPPLLKVGR
jgi:hypothetical protein